MHYSDKYQLFCTREQSVGSKETVWYVCQSFILKPVNSDGYDAVSD